MKNLGSLSIFKGEIGDTGDRMISWDAVPECDESCKLYDACPYDKSKKRCNLRVKYVESVMKSLTKSVKDPDPITLIRMGMLLMPLFNSLVDLKIEKHMSNGRVRGMKGIDPVMKEMRETIKQIDSMLVDLGVKVGGSLVDSKGKAVKRDNFLNGDSSYYDEMIGEGRMP